MPPIRVLSIDKSFIPIFMLFKLMASVDVFCIEADTVGCIRPLAPNRISTELMPIMPQ